MRTVLIFVADLMKNPPIRDDMPTSNPSPAGAASNRFGATTVESDVLFAGGNELVITHGTEIYRLRLTRQNRLILTK